MPSMNREFSRRAVLRAGLAGAAAIGFSAALTGRATAQSGSLRVGWWGDNSRAEATIKAFDRYVAEHPGLTINSEYTGFQGYLQKLTTQIAGGGAPDIFQLSPSNIRGYADTGALTDLRPYADSGAIDISAFDPGIIELCTIDGALITLPVGMNAGMTIVDATKLEELGFPLPDGNWTWDEYGALALEIAKKAGGGYWGTADGGGYRQTLETRVRQKGGAMFTEEGQLGFSRDDLAEHFDYWKQLRDNGAAVPATEQAIFQDQIDGLPAIRGLAAFDWTNSSIYAGIQALTEHRLEVTRLPVAALDNTGQSPQIALTLSINQQTANKDACVALLNYLVNDEDAIRTLGFSRGISPSSKIRDIVSATLGPDARRLFAVDLIALINTNPSKPAPLDPAGASSILPLLRKTNEDISFGKATVPEAVETFFSQAQRALGG